MSRDLLTPEEIAALLHISTGFKASTGTKIFPKDKRKRVTKLAVAQQIMQKILTIRPILAYKLTTLAEYLNWQEKDSLSLGPLLFIMLEVAKTPIFIANVAKHIDKRALQLVSRIDYKQSSNFFTVPYTPLESSKLCLADEVNLIANFPISIKIIYGSTAISLHDFIKLKVGDVLELDQFVDEPVEVWVNETLIALGSLANNNSNWSVRLTRLQSREHRLNSLDNFSISQSGWHE